MLRIPTLITTVTATGTSTVLACDSREPFWDGWLYMLIAIIVASLSLKG